MKIEVYDELPTEAAAIRKQVFMDEQGFKDEFDAIDKYAAHIVLSENATPVATCRFFYSNSQQCFLIGRIAVLKAYRGKNYGAKILKCAEQEIYKKGGISAGLSAQCQAAGFYKKYGYKVHGKPYLDEACPHIWMYKELNGNEYK